MKNQKGFTLIELLVVIAIIAILSGIAFLSIRDARNAAFDTQIKSEVSQIRTNAEQYYYDDGSYTDYATTEGWGRIATEIPSCSQSFLETGINIGNNSDDHSDIDDATTVYQINTGARSYAAWAPLCSDSTDSNIIYYCVDSEGNAGEYSEIGDISATKCIDGTSGLFTTEID